MVKLWSALGEQLGVIRATTSLLENHAAKPQTTPKPPCAPQVVKLWSALGEQLGVIRATTLLLEYHAA